MTSKPNDFIKKRKTTLLWGYSFTAIAALAFIFFLINILILQNSNVEVIEEEIISKNYRVDSLSPARGNLYATDGSILATTVMRYDVYIDFKTIKDTIYKNNISALSDSMSKMYNQPKSHFKQLFDKQRKKQNQYFALAKNLDFDQYDRLRNFPIFNKGKNKGGFIVDRKYKRELATTEIGAGTIGMDDERGKAGLESAFSQYLSGKKGFRTEQRINSNQWKPIDYWNEQEPIDGEDVYITLDLRIQDIATTALEKQLIEFNAKHGCVVVMEVETGKVRAMVNLTRTDAGYKDTYNYILKDGIEPGSTFKTVSLLAGMDDGFIDENTTVNVGDGNWTYAGQKISDGHGGGTYEISDVLAKSSNVGTAKLITRYYGSKPQVFLDHLKRWKMFDKMDIEIPGITKPTIVTPDNKRWNRATLASISYGYSTNFNLLQLATFYNGIANGGTMLKPLFIDKIIRDGKPTYQAKPQVMVQKMASDKAIQMMTNALTKAVEKGTAKSIFTPNLKMAGKTGTVRFEYWKKGAAMKYRASFAGFYPSDKPKYTCYVMVSEPDVSKGYYGATVAAPVFKEIAGKTFLKTPQNIEKDTHSEKKLDIKQLTLSPRKISVKDGIVPDMIGLAGMSVIPQLENEGYRVEYKGVGKVKEQFPAAGTRVKKDQKFYLVLQ